MRAAICLLGTLCAFAAPPPNPPSELAVRDAVYRVRANPYGERYQYVMSAGIRVALFWMSSEDVGTGLIRIGNDGEGREFIRLIIGSDPSKAPFSINRWGAATEVLQPASGESIFFGLMKPSGESSIAAARRAAAQDRDRAVRFQALMSANRPGSSIAESALVPFPRDFALNEVERVEEGVFDHLERNGTAPRSVEGCGCERSAGFLFTVHELIDAALAGRKGQRSCYVYDGRPYTLTLVHNEVIAERKVTLRFRSSGRESTRVYRDLRQAEFEVLNNRSGERTAFELLLGTRGPLNGVPIEIGYRPNWWFRINLSLWQPET